MQSLPDWHGLRCRKEQAGSGFAPHDPNCKDGVSRGSEMSCNPSDVCSGNKNGRNMINVSFPYSREKPIVKLTLEPKSLGTQVCKSQAVLMTLSLEGQV